VQEVLEGKLTNSIMKVT